jgi:uncharacterized protein YecT (DUF1311 family)
LGEPYNTLLGLFERAQHTPQDGWKLDHDERVRLALALGRKSASKQRQRGFGIGGLAPTLRSLAGILDSLGPTILTAVTLLLIGAAQLSAESMQATTDENKFAEISDRLELQIVDCLAEESSAKDDSPFYSMTNNCIVKVDALCLQEFPMNVQSMRDCWDMEFESWHRLRLRFFDEAVLELDKDSSNFEELKANLKRSDELWEKQRDAECDFLGERLGDNISSIDMSFTCDVETEAQRAIIYYAWISQ